jgi:hypothetical protein
MAVNFLAPAQRAGYGRYVRPPTPRELDEVFALDEMDRLRIGMLADPASALGYAAQLATLRFLGRFPNRAADVPQEVVSYLAGQLGIADASRIRHYTSEDTLRRHRRHIAASYGYHRFHDPHVAAAARRWLFRRAWLSDPRAAQLFDEAVAHLMAGRVILPGQRAAGHGSVGLAGDRLLGRGRGGRRRRPALRGAGPGPACRRLAQVIREPAGRDLV